MATGSTASSYQTVVGVAPEPQPASGTPVATAAAYMPIRKFTAKNNIIKLEDLSYRGSMVETVGVQNGPMSAAITAEGDAFADTFPFLVAGMLGDVSYTGGTNAGSPTTTTGILTAGVTAVVPVTSATGIVTGTVLAIDTAGLLELVTVLSVASLNVTLTQPVAKSHTSGVAVQPVTAPFTDTIALYNGGNGQPVSQTWTDSDPLSARQYASTRWSDLTVTFDSSKLLTYSATGLSWATQNTISAPVGPSYASFGPAPAWACQASYGGSTNATVQMAELSFKRSGSECIFTLQNTQNPYEVHVGPIALTVKLTIVASTEVFLTDYLAGNQKVLLLNLQQGAGATATQIQFQMSKFDLSDVEKNKGKSYIEFDVTGKAIGNTTDIGLSAGYSPCVATVKNAIAPHTYAN